MYKHMYIIHVVLFTKH